MTKYDAFKQWVHDEDYEDNVNFAIYNFEIAWESGQFNEEPKGECCK